MKNAYSWGLKHIIKRLSLPHSCLCLQRGAFPATVAESDHFESSCCCVWLFSTLSWPTAGPKLCLFKVNFQSRNTPAAVCVVLRTSFLKQPSECRFTLNCHEYIYSLHSSHIINVINTNADNSYKQICNPVFIPLCFPDYNFIHSHWHHEEIRTSRTFFLVHCVQHTHPHCAWYSSSLDHIIKT